jgi:hypothetical protein
MLFVHQTKLREFLHSSALLCTPAISCLLRLHICGEEEHNLSVESVGWRCARGEWYEAPKGCLNARGLAAAMVA